MDICIDTSNLDIANLLDINNVINVMEYYDIFEYVNPPSKFFVKRIKSNTLIIYERNNKINKEIIKFVFDYDKKELKVCDDFGGHGFSWTTYKCMHNFDMLNKVACILESVGFVMNK